MAHPFPRQYTSPSPCCYSGSGGYTPPPPSSDGGSYPQPIYYPVTTPEYTVKINFDGIKVDPKQETKCFDLAQGATLTIYVQQAETGTRDKVGNRQVGHVFVGIEQNGVTRYLGYYPPPDASQAGIAVGRDYPAEIRDNSGFSPYDVSVSTSISSAQLTEMVRYVNNFPKTYNLNNYACTDFGIAVAQKGGLNLPATTSSYLLFTGRSPGDLGEDIRAMTPPAGVTIDKSKTEKKAPTKKGGC